MVVVGPLGMGTVALRRLVDGATLGLTVAMFARLADPEILLETAFVIAGIGAVIYRFFAAVLRIVIVGTAALAYSLVASAMAVPLEHEVAEIVEPADFAEWPLMIGIAVIVAFLADRIATSARHYAALYREASERLLTAHEQERGRLARNLHDGVGQTLTAVILTLDAAESELWAGSSPPPKHARSSIARAQTLASAALEEARGVATQLRPARIHEIGLGAALANLARDAGVAVEVRFDPTLLPPGLLEAEPEIDAFRIVQEAIGNAARHSRASMIWIDCAVADDEIRLQVGDNGKGLDRAALTRGLGLAGMEERAAILHAKFELRSRRGKGTVITLTIPRPVETDALRRPAASFAKVESAL
jgi:two-component system, NarL family, sensor histidine kinase UhpB